MILAVTPAHPFHPFSGHNDPADLIRIVLIVASFALIMGILRVLIEGQRHHDMDRWQTARFVSVAILSASLSLGSATRFGTRWNGYVVANIVGVGLQFYGVIGIRREQRHRPEGH